MRPRRVPHTSASRHRLTFRAGLAAVALAALSIVGIPYASAATTTAWATWEPLSGAPGGYTSEMTLAGQPELTAEVTSDSRGGGGIGLISGSSNWLSEGTPIGEKYGTSRDQPYLNLGAQTGGPSTTTYTFAAPTPASGWAFALGDIDADMVRISGVSASGDPLTAADLGFQDGFNYCAPGVVGSPSCTGDPSDVPVWDPATMTLTGNDAAADTSGAAGWFEPSIAIDSLTFEFTSRSGIPVYQAWFASMARDITGTVSDLESGPLGGVVVTLTDRDGNALETTTTTDDGSYSFPSYFATDGYQVTATPPEGKIGVVTTGTADLRTDDAVVDLTVRSIPSLSGTVSAEGAGVGGVTVTATGPDGTLTTTTAEDGSYSFPSIGEGTYDVTITVPDGSVAVSPTTRSETVAEADVSDVDFELARLGSIAGAVTADGGEPLGGVTITVSGPDGTTTATTGEDGRYLIDGLPLGDYVVTVEAPDGFRVDGPVTRNVIITTSGEAVVDQDFALVSVPVPPTTPPTDDGDGTGSTGGTGSAGDEPPLAATGADSTPFITAGAITLLAGAILLATRRLPRRR